MPKEIAHWFIAEEVLRYEPAIAAVGNSKSSLAAYYIGAVAYDSPFYSVGLPNRDLIKRTGDELHGVGNEHTLPRFSSTAATIESGGPSIASAFLAGALTHYAADVTIHPMVNYFCNDSPIRERRHRALETCMDVYLTAKRKIPTPVTAGLRGLLRGVGKSELHNLAKIVSRFYQNDGSFDESLALRLMKRHAAIRDRFDTTILGGIVRRVAAAGSESAKVLAATFYPAAAMRRSILSVVEDFFGRPIEFYHPHTGENVSGTVDDLISTAAKLASSLIESLFIPAQDETSTPRPGEGHSFDSGMSLDAGCDKNRYGDEINHGFAELLGNAGFYYE